MAHRRCRRASCAVERRPLLLLPGRRLDAGGLDARVDISARYSARERRAVCVGVELDVGEVDLGWEESAGIENLFKLV